MISESRFSDFAGSIQACRSLAELEAQLPPVATGLGFDFYAIARHPGLQPGLRSARGDEEGPIHNYPEAWATRYVGERLVRCDPIPRACHVRSSGFRWRDAHRLVPFSARDGDMLDEAKRCGIEEGFTVPANVYGPARGSVSFATERGTPFPEQHLLEAQAIGAILFQTVLDIGWGRRLPRQHILTDRQLECVMWVARGKCNWAIGQLMGLSVNTVKKYLREACERYACATRTTLPLEALNDGSLCIADVFPERTPAIH